MKIALCHQNVLPARGGAEMYVADLARRLTANGHEIHLVTANWDAASVPSSCIVHRVARPRGPRFLRPWRFSESVAVVLRTLSIDVSIGFDKVLGTDIYYPLGGLHVATAEHNLLKHKPGLPRSIAQIIQRLDAANNSFAHLERRLMTGQNKPILIANSNLVRKHIQHYYGINPTDIPVVHNAIDPNRFDETDRLAIRTRMRSEWGLASDDVVGAMVAMNFRLKGLEPLLYAMALLPQPTTFKLLVAGGSRNGSWQRLADQLGIGDRVTFVGRCRDIRQVFFSADLLVHPTFYDPCSLVVLEAMACGLPVLTTVHNGASEIMSPPKEGFVVENPHNHLDMANRLVELLDGPRRVECGKAARHTSRNWTMDHHVRAIEQVCRQVALRRLRAAG